MNFKIKDCKKVDIFVQINSCNQSRCLSSSKIGRGIVWKMNYLVIILFKGYFGYLKGICFVMGMKER